jgi:hypothetical protein
VRGGVSANEYSCAYEAQINFEDLTPYLTYGLTNYSKGHSHAVNIYRKENNRHVVVKKNISITEEQRLQAKELFNSMAAKTSFLSISRLFIP